MRQLCESLDALNGNGQSYRGVSAAEKFANEIFAVTRYPLDDDYT